MSDTEDYLPRHLIPELEDAIASARVVNLIGPRQVGKTTLVRDLFGNGRFITLDDAAVLAAIEADPERQLTSLMEDLNHAPLIIDEAQRSKKLALAIKRVVDTIGAKGNLYLPDPPMYLRPLMSRTLSQAGCVHSSSGPCQLRKSKEHLSAA